MIDDCTKATLASDIRSIHTSDDLERFFHHVIGPNWTYNGNDESRKKFVNSMEKSQLSRLYTIIYMHPLPPSRSREVILRSISRYFESLERARRMKL